MSCALLVVIPDRQKARPGAGNRTGMDLIANMAEDNCKEILASSLNEASALAEKEQLSLNDALGAFHGLRTRAEERVVMSCIARLDSVRLEQGRCRIRLTAGEYGETFGIDSAKAYTQLKSVSQSLSIRVVRREEKTRQGIRIHHDHWVSGITFHDGDEWVELRFSHEATLYMIALRSNYTVSLQRQASTLRSIYSWRLLELMMKNKAAGRFQISVGDLAKALEEDTAKSRSFASLRREVIEPAVKELVDKDGWRVAWNPVKEGRKVIAVAFDFSDSPQGRFEI